MCMIYNVLLLTVCLATDLEVKLPEFLSNTPNFLFNALEIVEFTTVTVLLVPNQQSKLIPCYSNTANVYTEQNTLTVTD